MNIIELGLYVLDNAYLQYYYPKVYPHNKISGERPFFACFMDNKHPDIYWCIPISSKIHKYKPIINKYPNAGEILHLFGSNDSVLLTQNIIPVHKNFIRREFKVNQVHYKILNKTTKKNILKKARTMRALLMNNKHYFSANIINLYRQMTRIK